MGVLAQAGTVYQMRIYIKTKQTTKRRKGNETDEKDESNDRRSRQTTCSEFFLTRPFI